MYSFAHYLCPTHPHYAGIKDCGYEDAQENLRECPHCHGHHIDTLQRITGYLVGTTSRWNSGKLAELKDRVVHE